MSIPPRLRFVLGALLLVAAIFLAYAPAWHGGFVWDDNQYIASNPLLTASDGLWRIWFSLDSPSQYFPLVYTTFRFEHAIWGLNPTGYHLVNLALHAGNALLLWKLLTNLKVPGAPLAAVVFALHPIQVESVAWMTERKNVLMGFFFLLTLLAWTAFMEERERRRWIYYVAALIVFAFALFAKTTACTLPAALVLILWWRKKPISLTTISQIAPFVLLGFAMGLVSIWWERYHQGTHGAIFSVGIIERLLIASRSIWFYLAKLLWPARLTFIYPKWALSPNDPMAYLWVLAGAAAIAALVFGRKILGRGPEVAAIFFVATLSPLLGFIMLYTFRYTFVADHYQYLACIGPIALAAAGIDRLAGLVKNRGVFRSAATVGLALLLGILTWRQSGNYRDAETLWRRTIETNPGCWMAYTNLGIILFDQGKADDAISQYQRAIVLDPQMPEPHYNMSNALVQAGRFSEAIAESHIAITLRPTDPDAYISLGNAFLAEGDLAGSMEQYLKALELRPNESDAHYDLANVLERQGRLVEAAAHYEKAIACDPNSIDARVRLGDVFLQQMRDRDALAQYEGVLRIEPDLDVAQNNLAWLLTVSSDPTVRNVQRGRELAEAVSRKPGGQSPIFLRTLAAACAATGDFDRAVTAVQTALEMSSGPRDEALAEELRRNLELYRAHQPYQTP